MADPTRGGEGSGSSDGSDRGSLTFADRVIERIASISAVEVESVVTSGSRLDKVVGHRYPKADVQQAGQHVRIAMELALAWPASLPNAAAQARDHVTERVAALTGLSVDVVDVSVAQMVRAQRTALEMVR